MQIFGHRKCKVFAQKSCNSLILSISTEMRKMKKMLDTIQPNGQNYVGMAFRRNGRRVMPIDNRRNSKKKRCPSRQRK